MAKVDMMEDQQSLNEKDGISVGIKEDHLYSQGKAIKASPMLIQKRWNKY